jgi:hypothetical protein
MRARMTLPLLATSLLLGAASAASAQTPADSGRHEEAMRSRGWMYLPRFQYRMPRIRMDLDHLRMNGLDRAQRVRERQFALEDRLRDRRFDLENRLRDRRFELRDRLRGLEFDRQDRVFRRQMELQDRLRDRMHDRMDRLERVRPFRFGRRYRSI